jgi:DivIVA domain-containing protein
MVPGAHQGSAYSEGEGTGPADDRSWLLRLWHLVRPPLPAPLTASMPVSDPGIRRTSLARLRPEDVRQVRFSSARFREGYHQEQVDAFLDRVETQLRTGRAGPSGGILTAEDVIDQRFTATKFRVGYDQDEVDDFLDRIVTELRRDR